MLVALFEVDGALDAIGTNILLIISYSNWNIRFWLVLQEAVEFKCRVIFLFSSSPATGYTFIVRIGMFIVLGRSTDESNECSTYMNWQKVPRITSQVHHRKNLLERECSVSER